MKWGLRSTIALKQALSPDAQVPLFEPVILELTFASDVQMAQIGADTQLHIGSSLIDLVGVNMATLDSTDFRFA